MLHSPILGMFVVTDTKYHESPILLPNKSAVFMLVRFDMPINVIFQTVYLLQCVAILTRISFFDSPFCDLE
jgi:hypothetical protein